MKKHLLTILTFAIALSAGAQSFVEDNFQNLIDDDNSTVIKVSQEMFKYAAIAIDDELDEEGINAKEILSGIKSLHVVVAEEIDNPKAEFTRGKRKIGDKYDELISIKSKDGNFGVYIDEDNGTVYEIIAIGAEDEEFFVGSVLCNVRLEDISGIMSKIQTEDWKPFKKMKDLDLDDLNVYPNPVATSTGLSLEVPKAMVGGEAMLVNSSGSTVKSYDIDGVSQNLDVQGITPGYYVISVNNAGVTLKKKVLVVE